MLYRLASIASEPLFTTINISTIVAARIPTRVVGLIFLIITAFSIQLVFSSPQIKPRLVEGIIGEVPIISSNLGPTTTSFSTSKLETSESFKETIVGSDQNFTYNSPNFDIFGNPQTISTPNGTLLYNKKLRVFATSYDQFCPGCSSYTASGLKAGYGVIAVDPNVIPLGTKVYVPGYGEAIAGDTGGAIKGAVVDLGFDNVKNGWWSSRFTEIYILK